LHCFIQNKKIPNIIFHGNSGSGKNAILSNFLTTIYQGDQTVMKNYIMNVNCAYGRGIRFIREDLKFFAKTNVDLMDGERFKSIVLLNADKLTIDAQSALRRCIELFCHSTRFFIVVEDKNKLLKPILSRFCDLYIPDIISTDPALFASAPPPPPSSSSAGECAVAINLYRYNLEKTLDFRKLKTGRLEKLKSLLESAQSAQSGRAGCCYSNLMTVAEELYERGYSALDIITLLEMEPDTFSNLAVNSNDHAFKKYELLIAFSRVKREFRNEKLLILFIMYFMQFRSELDLKNITFI